MVGGRACGSVSGRMRVPRWQYRNCLVILSLRLTVEIGELERVDKHEWWSEGVKDATGIMRCRFGSRGCGIICACDCSRGVVRCEEMRIHTVVLPVVSTLSEVQGEGRIPLNLQVR